MYSPTSYVQVRFVSSCHVSGTPVNSSVSFGFGYLVSLPPARPPPFCLPDPTRAEAPLYVLSAGSLAEITLYLPSVGTLVEVPLYRCPIFPAPLNLPATQAVPQSCPGPYGGPTEVGVSYERGAPVSTVGKLPDLPSPPDASCHHLVDFLFIRAYTPLYVNTTLPTLQAEPLSPALSQTIWAYQLGKPPPREASALTLSGTQTLPSHTGVPRSKEPAPPPRTTIGP